MLNNKDLLSLGESTGKNSWPPSFVLPDCREITIGGHRAAGRACDCSFTSLLMLSLLCRKRECFLSDWNSNKRLLQCVACLVQHRLVVPWRPIRPLLTEWVTLTFRRRPAVHGFHKQEPTGPAMGSPPSYQAYNHGCGTGGFRSIIQHQQQPSPLGKSTSHATSLSSPMETSTKLKRSFTIASLIADDSDSSDDEQLTVKQTKHVVDDMTSLLDGNSADSTSFSWMVSSDDESEVNIETEDAEVVSRATAHRTTTPLKKKRTTCHDDAAVSQAVACWKSSLAPNACPPSGAHPFVNGLRRNGSVFSDDIFIIWR